MFHLSLNSDTVPSLQFQLNFHTSSHWATWYEGEKVSNFLAWFHLRCCCRIIRSLMSAELGALEGDTGVPFFLAFLVLQRRQVTPDAGY